jgi:hypothetical protein
VAGQQHPGGKTGSAHSPRGRGGCRSGRSLVGGRSCRALPEGTQPLDRLGALSLSNGQDCAPAPLRLQPSTADRQSFYDGFFASLRMTKMFFRRSPLQRSMADGLVLPLQQTLAGVPVGFRRTGITQTGKLVLRAIVRHCDTDNHSAFREYPCNPWSFCRDRGKSFRIRDHPRHPRENPWTKVYFTAAQTRWTSSWSSSAWRNSPTSVRCVSSNSGNILAI